MINTNAQQLNFTETQLIYNDVFVNEPINIYDNVQTTPDGALTYDCEKSNLKSIFFNHNDYLKLTILPVVCNVSIIDDLYDNTNKIQDKIGIFSLH